MTLWSGAERALVRATLTVVLLQTTCAVTRILAFQSVPLSPLQVKKRSSMASTMFRSTRREMADSSYSISPDSRWGDRPFFLSPLFRYYDHIPKRRNFLTTSSSLVLGSTGGFSFLGDDSDDQDDDDPLSYLPAGLDLPPATRDLLTRVTYQYVHEGNQATPESPVSVEDVLDVIGSEYRTSKVRMTVGKRVFMEKSGEEDDAVCVKILAFAALYCLPRDVAILLFGPNEEEKDETTTVAECRTAFENGGWKDVTFPDGLGIRLRRKFLGSRKKYVPLPLSWLKSSSKAAKEAAKAVEKATYTKPPTRRVSREAFLASMEQEFTSSTRSPLAEEQNVPRDILTFFPSQNRFLKRLRRAIAKQTSLLKQYGRAGLISYGAVNFAWFIGEILWHWRSISREVHLLSFGAIGASFREFGREFVSAFLGFQLTTLPRLILAVSLAPLGGRALRFIQRKFRVTENAALGIAAALLLGSCFGLWTTIALFDAAISRIFRW